MQGLRAAVVIAAIALTSVSARVQEPSTLKPDKFSPLGFDDLRAYEQAFPGDVGSPVVVQANAGKYWAFRGVAYRGTTPSVNGVWTSLGPETLLENSNQIQKTISGRVSALLIAPRCGFRGSGCRLWVGTAGGGVWRTDDAMNTTDPHWQWMSRGLGTNNIGSLALDPNDRLDNTIYVGTGETNTPNNSGAGTGLYKSTDAGLHWTRISTMVNDAAVSPSPIDFTFTRGISTVVVQPGNSKTIYVATTSAMLGMTAVRGGQSQTTGSPQPRTGLYKTENGGVSWSLIWVPPLDPVMPVNPNLGVGIGDTMFGVRDVKLDPRNPRIVYATAFNNAIHRSAPSLERGDATFKPIFAIVGLQRFRDLAMFDIVISGRRNTRLYVYNGTDNQATQGLYRLDNADQPASALVRTAADGSLVNTSAWIGLTADNTTSPSSTSRRICGSQCFYDLVVASPDREPNTVLIGGQLHPDFGEPTIRSTNAGVSFSMFGSDAQNPQNSSHVDVRAIVFHPRDSRIVFVGSDGGVVRSDGGIANIANRCSSATNASQCQAAMSAVPNRLYFMNRGLQTTQFYNISVDPLAPLQRMMGGLQDNSTIWMDGTDSPRLWKTVFPFGDGTSASGFHPSRQGVIFASFQSNNFFTSFRDGARWVRTDFPIRASNERATISASTGRQFITFDQAAPDTQFTGFQHIWRTQSNGGSQTTLEASCTFNGSGGTSSICGDWIPLGVAFPFVAGSTPDSASRKPGDLTSDFYGADRAGGIVVSAERSPADLGTLWAATNFGRLFISKNANAAGSSVTFTRLDGGLMPNRFVTRIVADPANANAAYVSYSGFNALTPSSPGHVFRAVYNPGTQQATFTQLDFNLGDLPINTIALDPARGDLYAATDFGPLVLQSGTTEWQAAGVGFPEALMVDLKIVPSQRLLIAATHGLGIFYLTLQ